MVSPARTSLKLHQVDALTAPVPAQEGQRGQAVTPVSAALTVNPARKPAVSASGSSAPSRPADRAATLITTVEMPAEQEPGTVLYVLHRSWDEPDLFWVCDLYADDHAFAAQPDPDGDDPRLDRGVSLDTTFDGAGVICGDLSPGCAAMVQAVLDALSAPQGGGDLRTRQRYHDALAEAMRRLLASDLLPQRAGQPVKALVHVSFADLCQLDADSGIQDRWIAEYRARWAAHRAANSVATGDGGAWLDGDAARQVACDAMIIPVVTGDIDPAAVEDLIDLCVRYHQLRTQAEPEPEPVPAAPVPAGSTTRHAEVTAAAAAALAEMEQQILAKILQVVSGPGGAASFLRRHLLGKPLAGPSLPLDVGQTDDIPLHLRRLVALRDQDCQYPGGYFL